MRIFKKKFGDVLREKRKEKGFSTQESFANALDIDRSRVARWESGAQFPNHEHMSRIASVLNIHPEDLAQELERENTPQPILERLEALERMMSVISESKTEIPADLLEILSRVPKENLKEIRALAESLANSKASSSALPREESE